MRSYQLLRSHYRDTRSGYIVHLDFSMLSCGDLTLMTFHNNIIRAKCGIKRDKVSKVIGDISRLRKPDSAYSNLYIESLTDLEQYRLLRRMKFKF